MVENPEGGEGSRSKQPDLCQAGRAVARGRELLDEAQAYLDAGDFGSARSAVEIAAVQYLDVAWYTGGRPQLAADADALGSHGAELAIKVGSEVARRFFPSVEIDEAEDGEATEPAKPKIGIEV